MEIEQLQKTIECLNHKIEVLENKLECISNFIGKTHCEFIPHNCNSNSISLQEYLNALMFKEEDLDEILTFDMLHFIKNVIKKNKGLPIYRDKIKPKILYHKKWTDFNKEHSKEILQYIHKKIIGVFSTWKNENNNRLNEDNFNLPLYIQKIFLLNDNIYTKFYYFLNTTY